MSTMFCAFFLCVKLRRFWFPREASSARAPTARGPRAPFARLRAASAASGRARGVFWNAILQERTKPSAGVRPGPLLGREWRGKREADSILLIPSSSFRGALTPRSRWACAPAACAACGGGLWSPWARCWGWRSWCWRWCWRWRWRRRRAGAAAWRTCWGWRLR